MEDYEKERINKASEELHSNHMRSIIIDSYSTPVIQVIGASAGATIVVYGGYLIIHGVITPGDFTSFILSFFMLNDPVRIYRRIYDSLYEYADSSTIPHAVLILSKYQYQSAFVADQEINLLACLTEIMVDVKWK